MGDDADAVALNHTNMAVTTSALASTGVPVPMVGSHPPRPLAWPRPAPCRPPTDDTDASAPGDGYADWEDGPCGVMTLTRGAPTPTNTDPTVQPALTAPGSRRLSRLPTAPYLSLSDKAPRTGTESPAPHTFFNHSSQSTVGFPAAQRLPHRRSVTITILQLRPAPARVLVH